jgi:hypothetical protein
MQPNFGLQPIDQKIANLLKPLFLGNKKEFGLINNLVKNWQEIVGKKYAQFCYPKSVSLSKKKASEGRLIVGVYNSGVGFFLENNSEIILERIAAFYGYKSIFKIIIKQEPKNINVFKDNEIKLPKQEEDFLQNKTAEISDKNLAETLQKLGRRIFQK